jgi:hypothetical protein
MGEEYFTGGVFDGRGILWEEGVFHGRSISWEEYFMGRYFIGRAGVQYSGIVFRFCCTLQTQGILS